MPQGHSPTSLNAWALKLAAPYWTKHIARILSLRPVFIAFGFVRPPNVFYQAYFFFQLFSWMTPLMKKGATQFITEEDLPPLTKSDESAKLGEDLKNALKTQ